MGRAELEFGPIKAATGQLGHAVGTVDPHLIYGLRLEHGHLVQFLKTAGADPHRPRLGSERHHWRMRPVSCSHGGDKIRRARPILSNAGLRPSSHPGQTVSSVRSRLLVGHGNEPNTGVGEQIEGVHER